MHAFKMSWIRCLVPVLLVSCSLAVELPVEHSLDGGLSFKQAGVVEGNFKVWKGCTHVDLELQHKKECSCHVAIAPLP